LPVGNDVVDLAAPGARGKWRDERFLRRVFTAAEAALIRGAHDPDRTLWLLWAAKEAAFKVVRQLRPEAPFAHRQLAVAPATDAAPRRLRGRVIVRGLLGPHDVAVEAAWRHGRAYVHCLATAGTPGPAQVRAALGRLPVAAPGAAAGERSATQALESEAVRRLARRLAAAAGLGAVEVVRARRDDGRLAAPRLHAPGAPAPLAGWSLSLSHDGRFVAAALARH
jgi:phosphopantetheine--protein transferase-like protein